MQQRIRKIREHPLRPKQGEKKKKKRKVLSKIMRITATKNHSKEMLKVFRKIRKIVENRTRLAEARRRVIQTQVD
jgi:hypothetical protein